jgi:hypothetical protein
MLPAHTVAVEAKKRMDEIRPGLFEQCVWRCLTWGVVIKRPDMFFLAEPVWVKGKKVKYEGKGEPNCWWIHCLVGTLDMAYFKSLVKPLKYYGWERNNNRVKDKVKIYKWEQGVKGNEQQPSA